MEDPADRSRTRLSHAHERPDLRKDNPLYERAGSIGAQFEQGSPERAERRESFMIKRQQPKPVLRPSPSLAAGVDRQEFERQLEQERREAIRHAQNLRSELLKVDSALVGHERQRKQANEQARSGDPHGAAKKLFHIKRGVKNVGERMTAHVQAFERAHGDL